MRSSLSRKRPSHSQLSRIQTSSLPVVHSGPLDGPGPDRASGRRRPAAARARRAASRDPTPSGSPSSPSRSTSADDLFQPRGIRSAAQPRPGGDADCWVHTSRAELVKPAAHGSGWLPNLPVDKVPSCVGISQRNVCGAVNRRIAGTNRPKRECQETNERPQSF